MGTLSLAIGSISISIAIGDGTETRSILFLAFFCGHLQQQNLAVKLLSTISIRQLLYTISQQQDIFHSFLTLQESMEQKQMSIILN